MKKFPSFLFVFLLGIAFTSTTFAVFQGAFTDVPENHWAKGAINWAADLGLVKGDDGQNTFRPDDSITRAELVTVIKRYDDSVRGLFSVNEPYRSMLSNGLKTAQMIEEMENPNLELPIDIHPDQIEKYFKMGDLYFALVLRPSMNFALTEVREDPLRGYFSGMLVSHQGANTWNKFLEIKDMNPDPSSSTSNKNNPYYLWIHDGKIYLSIVDHNGAGSGEGREKVYTSDDGWNWEILDCYYFGYLKPNDDSTDDFSWDFVASSYLDRMATGKELVEEQESEGITYSEEEREEMINGCKDDAELVIF